MVLKSESDLRRASCRVDKLKDSLQVNERVVAGLQCKNSEGFVSGLSPGSVKECLRKDMNKENESVERATIGG